jgi:hypothetical protein
MTPIDDNPVLFSEAVATFQRMVTRRGSLLGLRPRNTSRERLGVADRKQASEDSSSSGASVSVRFSYHKSLSRKRGATCEMKLIIPALDPVRRENHLVMNF